MAAAMADTARIHQPRQVPCSSITKQRTVTDSPPGPEQFTDMDVRIRSTLAAFATSYMRRHLFGCRDLG